MNKRIRKKKAKQRAKSEEQRAWDWLHSLHEHFPTTRVIASPIVRAVPFRYGLQVDPKDIPYGGNIIL